MKSMEADVVALFLRRTMAQRDAAKRDYEESKQQVEVLEKLLNDLLARDRRGLHEVKQQ